MATLTLRVNLVKLVGTALALALTAVVTTAQESWRSKPPAQWTQEEAVALVTDSPWARRIEIYQASGRLLGVLRDGSKVVHQEGPGQPPHMYDVEPERIEPELLRAVYIVRWSSAETVQQALARLRELSAAVAEAQAPPPELSRQHIAITVRVSEPPRESALDRFNRPLLVDEAGRPVTQEAVTIGDIFQGLSEEELRGRAELRTEGGGRVLPERVQRHGLGTGEGITFFFPRAANGQATVPPAAAWAEFVFTSPKKETLKARFRLKEMVMAGRPDD